MNASIFDNQYADQYDLLYGDKDYESECDLLEAAFRRYSSGNMHSVLDLGCGTGNHAIPLARRGYSVTGVDVSAEMLVHAREKSADLGKQEPQLVQDLVFYHQNLRSFQDGKTYDAVLMMFAVLGYQLNNEDVVAALQTVRKHLRVGGVFLFDVWYGPAVLTIRPSDRVKIIPIINGELIRAASGSLDTCHQYAEVSYHLWRIQNRQVVSETMERHQMRYFFYQELAYFLGQAGMRLESLTAFPTLDQAPSERSWNVVGIATSSPTR